MSPSRRGDQPQGAESDRRARGRQGNAPGAPFPLVDQLERPKRVAEAVTWDELAGMGPEPLDLSDLRSRVLGLDLLVELAGLVRALVADDRVLAGPVQPQREREARELVHVGERAALVPARLVARQLVEELGDRHVPFELPVVEGGALEEAA